MLDENYYQISGWMMNRLKLKGISLNVYAIIYGFTQDGETEFTGSINYLRDACGGICKNTVLSALRELVSKGYILKSETLINNVKIVGYKVSLQAISDLYKGGSKIERGAVQKLNWGGSKSEQGVVQKINGGGSKIAPNNNNHNNNHNDIDNNNIPDFSKISLESEFEKLWKIYPRKEEKKRAFTAYVKARTRKESPCTFDDVKKGIERYCKTVINTEIRYIKNGATWFNGECWNDEYSSQTSPEKPVDPEIEKYKVLINKF